MTEWWQEPYRGGPMVDVAGFPRALYPPDVPSPRDASPNGPDVEAYKRAVSRAGRWPWTTFDRAFTNGFAHGRSGNVAETGVAGLQRQLGIPDSGWIGKDTFNGIRSIRIPDGLPNAGEPALDARAVELINQAYVQFNGSVVGARQKAMDHMQARLGFTEQPAGSNTDSRTNGIRTAQIHCAGGGTWLVGTYWCGEWCYYALETAGVEGIDYHMASVALIEDYARKGLKCYRGWTTDHQRVRKGDLVVIGGYGVHVGMVRGFDDADTLTYEGNTSAGIIGSQNNGGGAYARVRHPWEVRGYALVEFPGD